MLNPLSEVIDLRPMKQYEHLHSILRRGANGTDLSKNAELVLLTIVCRVLRLALRVGRTVVECDVNLGYLGGAGWAGEVLNDTNQYQTPPLRPS